MRGVVSLSWKVAAVISALQPPRELAGLLLCPAAGATSRPAAEQVRQPGDPCRPAGARSSAALLGSNVVAGVACGTPPLIRQPSEVRRSRRAGTTSALVLRQ